MIRPVLKYGSTELVKMSSSVSIYDEDLQELVRDMTDTMYAARGIGLAAPQVGVNLRVIVIDVEGTDGGRDPLKLINPRILFSEGREKGEEGCLSIPGVTAVVERPRNIKVQAEDPGGKRLELKAEGTLARVICHEVDHLDGILYLDRISLLRRDVIKRKIKKLIKAGDWV
jgi:peptide deformylase